MWQALASIIAAVVAPVLGAAVQASRRSRRPESARGPESAAADGDRAAGSSTPVRPRRALRVRRVHSSGRARLIFRLEVRRLVDLACPSRFGSMDGNRYRCRLVAVLDGAQGCRTSKSTEDLSRLANGSTLALENSKGFFLAPMKAGKPRPYGPRIADMAPFL